MTPRSNETIGQGYPSSEPDRDIIEFSKSDMVRAYEAFELFIQDSEIPNEMMRIKSSDLAGQLQERGLTLGLSIKLIDDLASRKVFVTGKEFVTLRIFVPLSGGPMTDEILRTYRYLYFTRRRLRDFFARKKKERVRNKVPIAVFPTPPKATWRQVEIKFVDGETVSIKVGGESGRYLFSEMGMVDGRNKKPTKQWELLRAFARKNGWLTWDSSDSNHRNQKRCEILNLNLIQFFGIKEKPIVLTDDRKSWCTVFSLESDS